MSVDETETVTSEEEHFFIVRRTQAPGRAVGEPGPGYVGRFEKGVDYIGDLDEFEASFARHAAFAPPCPGP